MSVLIDNGIIDRIITSYNFLKLMNRDRHKTHNGTLFAISSIAIECSK
jgi:hypothetical protein